MATITSPRATSPSIPSIASPISTPTSSVRPSLELPHPDGASSSTTTAAAAPSQRPRNRAALRDYYNLKSRTPASGVTPTSALARTNSIASASSAASDTSATTSTAQPSNNNGSASDTSPLLAQLDNPNFNAQSFIDTLLKTSSLRDILRTESALVSEIRTLDGERKALVYDNYSKLIKAVGTIGEMQRGMQRRDTSDGFNNKISVGSHTGEGRGGGELDGVEALQEKLSYLETEVRELRPLQDGDDSEESDAYEDEVRQRKRVKAQKELVKWVLAAPGRLEDMQDMGEAEMEWARVKMLLDRWEGTRGVEEVRRAGEEAMKAKLRTGEKKEGSQDGDDGAT